MWGGNINDADNDRHAGSETLRELPTSPLETCQLLVQLLILF
jgi:hypothetical protein